MVMVLDGENKDDVVGDDDVGVSIGANSVDGGDDPHGLRFFRCHGRGDGSVSGFDVMTLLLLLLLRCHRCCRCLFRRFHGRCHPVA